MNADSLVRLAHYWMMELRGDKAMIDADIGGRVTFMNFTSPPEKQWIFLLAAIDFAETDKELSHIAAGPLEHLLGFHGDAYIDRVEKQAAQDPKFARTLTGAWQHLASDAVWARVREIQSHVLAPLPAYEPLKPRR